MPELPTGRYIVLVSDYAAETMQKLASQAGQQETGGILIGYYRDGQALITEATLPPSDSWRSYARFERGVNGLKEYLADKWLSEPREYYLGEWHSHPATLACPSPTDHLQMRKILDDPNIDCASPILIVVAGHSKPSPIFSIHVYDGMSKSPYPLY